MRPNITVLRRLLKTWQKQWHMSDWRMEVNVVERLPSPVSSSWAYIQWDEYHRLSRIQLLRCPQPNEQGFLPGHAFSLAHEFAHLLLVDLDECLNDAIRTCSVDAQQQTRLRWELVAERFCNAFASALTTEEKKP